MDKPKHINHHTQNIWIYTVGMWTIQMPLPDPPVRIPWTQEWAHRALFFKHTAHFPRKGAGGAMWSSHRPISVTTLQSSCFLAVSYTAESSLRGGMESHLLSSPPDHTWLSEAKWLVQGWTNCLVCSLIIWMGRPWERYPSRSPHSLEECICDFLCKTAQVQYNTEK